MHIQDKVAALDKYPQTQEVPEVGHQSIQTPTFQMILGAEAGLDLSLETESFNGSPIIFYLLKTCMFPLVIPSSFLLTQ